MRPFVVYFGLYLNLHIGTNLSEYFDIVIDRVKIALNVKTDKDLAAALKLTKTALSNRRLRNSLPYDEIIAALNERAIDLNAVFATDDRDINRESAAHHTSKFVDDGEFSYVPLYNLSVSAGNGAFVNSENIITTLAFRTESLKRQSLNAKRLGCASITGDSMEPTIKPRDTIMFNFDAQSPDGGIYVIRVGDVIYCKRLIRIADGIRVISDNALYEPYTITEADNYQIIARVIWASGFL